MVETEHELLDTALTLITSLRFVTTSNNSRISRFSTPNCCDTGLPTISTGCKC